MVWGLNVGALFQLLWWVSELTETGVVQNAHLDKLPPELWQHLIAIGEYIAKTMGWGN